MKTKKTYFLFWLAYVLAGGVVLTSCGTTKDINYLQDFEDGLSIALDQRDIRLRPGDDISVFVKTQEELLTERFNKSLPIMQNIVPYTVAADGTIELPMTGKVKVEGMTREQAASAIKKPLVAQYGVDDAVVSVEFKNLHVTVMGEVNKPGVVEIEHDRVTIFDALGAASDLSIYGLRERVMVLREEGGQEKVYTLNLKEGRQLLTSPAYYLQQNDVVYVPGSKMRSREATVNGNNFYSASFWMSLTSLLTTVVVLIVK